MRASRCPSTSKVFVVAKRRIFFPPDRNRVMDLEDSHIWAGAWREEMWGTVTWIMYFYTRLSVYCQTYVSGKWKIYFKKGLFFLAEKLTAVKGGNVEVFRKYTPTHKVMWLGNIVLFFFKVLFFAISRLNRCSGLHSKKQTLRIIELESLIHPTCCFRKKTPKKSERMNWAYQNAICWWKYDIKHHNKSFLSAVRPHERKWWQMAKLQWHGEEWQKILVANIHPHFSTVRVSALNEWPNIWLARAGKCYCKHSIFSVLSWACTLSLSFSTKLVYACCICVRVRGSAQSVSADGPDGRSFIIF